MRKLTLCSLTDLRRTGAKGVTLNENGIARDLFVVCKDGKVYAYENCCPHTGGPLDWMPDQFLDDDGKLIVCATHAALFRIDDGRCTAGPCAGASLRAVSIVVDDGMIDLREEAGGA